MKSRSDAFRSSRGVAPVKGNVAELRLAGAGGELVDLWRTINSHGVADLPPNRIDQDARTLEVTVWAGGKPQTAIISEGRKGYARVEVRGGKDDSVLEVVRNMLGPSSRGRRRCFIRSARR